MVTRFASSIIEYSRGVAQPGSAPALGAGGRRFKSYRPDQFSLASSFFIFRNLRTDPSFLLEPSSRSLAVAVILHCRPISRSARCYPFSVMEAKGLTPILNVSDIASTVVWFEKWGWKKLWDWGTPPTFGAVGSGKEACIFLCQGAQGGRGRGTNTTTFQQDGDEAGDKGVWMSVWVDDVDAMHKHCVAAGLEITFPPTDMPWNVREMHLRHPDGHVFRVGRGFEGKE